MAFGHLKSAKVYKYIVQEYIGKHRAEITTLGRTLFGRDDSACFTVPSLQKSADQQQKAWVFDADLQKLHHPLVRNIIKVAFDLCLNHIADGLGLVIIVLSTALMA